MELPILSPMAQTLDDVARAQIRKWALKENTPMARTFASFTELKTALTTLGPEDSLVILLSPEAGDGHPGA